MNYKTTIGLEIHAELKTKTKMFCDSKNDTEEKTPNVNICPVCMGHPGTLPTINKEAVKKVLKVGVALGADMGGLDEDGLAKFRRGRMGVVFQSFHLIPTMTALENVAVPMEIAGTPDAFARAEAELEAVGLATRRHHYPAQLSGGEQQRVALARAAAPRPTLLLADEPTGNLDSVNGAAIMDLIFGLRDRHGATLVMVTHAPELAARCDRVVRLVDGRIDGAAL